MKNNNNKFVFSFKVFFFDLQSPNDVHTTTHNHILKVLHTFSYRRLKFSKRRNDKWNSAFFFSQRNVVNWKFKLPIEISEQDCLTELSCNSYHNVKITQKNGNRKHFIVFTQLFEKSTNALQICFVCYRVQNKILFRTF